MPLIGMNDDSLDLSGLGAALSELCVGLPEGKEKEKETGKGRAGALRGIAPGRPMLLPPPRLS